MTVSKITCIQKSSIHNMKFTITNTTALLGDGESSVQRLHQTRMSRYLRLQRKSTFSVQESVVLRSHAVADKIFPRGKLKEAADDIPKPSVKSAFSINYCLKTERDFQRIWTNILEFRTRVLLFRRQSPYTMQRRWEASYKFLRLIIIKY